MTIFETASANTYIDFFAGCGGLSLGLGWGGWRGVFAIEKDPMAFKTFNKNLIVENAPHQHFKNWPAWLTKEPHTIEDVLENKDTVDQLKNGWTSDFGGRWATLPGIFCCRCPQWE